MRATVALAGVCAVAAMGLGLFQAAPTTVSTGFVSQVLADGTDDARTQAEAALKAELEASGCNPTYLWCSDFDHDGSYEAFAIDGTLEAPLVEGEESDGGVNGGSLWYTAGAGTTRVVEEVPNAHPKTNNSGLQCGPDRDFISLFIYAHGSGGTTKLYTVRDGSPVAVDAGDMQGLWAGKDGIFASDLSVWGETGGHAFKRVFMHWDEGAWVFRQFAETPAYYRVGDGKLDFGNGLVLTLTDGWVDADGQQGATASVEVPGDGGAWSVEGVISSDATGTNRLVVSAAEGSEVSSVAWYGDSGFVDASSGEAVVAQGEGCFEYAAPHDEPVNGDEAGSDQGDQAGGGDQGGSDQGDQPGQDDAIQGEQPGQSDADGQSGLGDASGSQNSDGGFDWPSDTGSDLEVSDTSAPTYSDVSPSGSMGESYSQTGSLETADGTIPYSFYCDTNVSIATVDGGTRILHNLFVTNMSYSPTDAPAGQYVEGYILTNGSHCIRWAGKTTGGSLQILQFWYHEGGIDYPVMATSYDKDGYHWFGFNPLTSNFPIG